LEKNIENQNMSLIIKPQVKDGKKAESFKTLLLIQDDNLEICAIILRNL